MIRATLFAVTALLVALALGACGQKGPLKLPDAAKPAAPASPPDAPKPASSAP